MKLLNLYYFFLMLVCFGCSNEEKELNEVLDLAGKNRTELECVLNHYENGTDKYRAARFLIKNMSMHYSYDGAYLNGFHNQVDSFMQKLPPVRGYVESELAKAIIDSLKGTYPKTVENRVYDIQKIKAQYLIDNIDKSFEIWDKSPWVKHLAFDDFCEFVLPYRIEDGYVLEDWRNSISNQLDSDILYRLSTFDSSSEMKNSAYWACIYVNLYLKHKLSPDYAPIISTNVFRVSTLSHIPYGTCDENTVVTTGVMRSLGIPVAIDFTYQWPFRSLGHSWNVLLANNGKKMPFMGCATGPDVIHKPEHKMAKVYRKTYSMNRDIVDLMREEKRVPKAFCNPFIKDVTNEYMQPCSIEIPVKWDIKQKYAYLAVFDNKEWIPVCYGKRKKDSYVFENIGKNIAYLPVYFAESGLVPFAEPFILDAKGKVEFILPDIEETESVKLFRKYFISESLYSYVTGLENGVLEASENDDFSQAYHIKTVTQWSIQKDSVFVNFVKQYRYWRFLASPNHVFNIAELEFYDGAGSLMKPIKLIGTGHPQLPDRDIEAAFDGDILSFFKALPDVKQPWIGVDFGKPVHISKIVYTPRNDDNNIRKGDEYELFYWTRKGWVSLGRKIGTSNVLFYDEVPSGALFLLKDLSRGKETRIFTYKDDKQVWW